MKPAVVHPLLRRPTPPAACPPPPPSPSPFASPSLPLPSALLPPKKRRVFHTPRRASTPIPPPPPLPALAAGGDSLGVSAPIPPPPAASLPVAKKPPSRPSGKPPLPPRPRPEKSGNPRTVAAAAGEASALHTGDGCASMDRDEVGDKDQNLGETLLGKDRERGGTLAGDATEVGKVMSKSEEGGEEGEILEKMTTQVFVGGLDRNAKEEDVRVAMARAGEVTEVRMVMDAWSQKNKGYCFVRYREAREARKAIEEIGHVKVVLLIPLGLFLFSHFPNYLYITYTTLWITVCVSNLKICTSLCRIAAVERNDRIFLGNIDKKWKKEDIMKLLLEIEVENISTVILNADFSKPGYNRGYAHLEFDTTKDAQMAYKKLSRKGVFGRCINITVAWAKPSTGSDEKDMLKVKSVFVEGIPDSWDRAKVTKIFKRYGEVDHVVLSCDMRSASSNDIAYIHYTTREAAILCVESFDGQELTETGSKANIKVALARPFRKGKNNKEDHKFTPYPNEHSSTMYSREKRGFAILGDDSSVCTRRNLRARHESTTYAMSTSSYGVSPHCVSGYSPPYHHGSNIFLPDSNYGVAHPWFGSMIDCR
ncbi:hypothetical protein EJB05_13039, partial [Eragrostis curvula]